MVLAWGFELSLDSLGAIIHALPSRAYLVTIAVDQQWIKFTNNLVIIGLLIVAFWDHVNVASSVAYL